MASTDDITNIRSEIRGSGPVGGRGGDQPYIDPSMVFPEMDNESRYRTIHKGGIDASKFFGLFGAAVGAAGGGLAKLVFRGHITNGWKSTGIGALATGILGAISGYFMGRSAVAKHFDENAARMKAYLEGQGMPLPLTGEVPLPNREKDPSGEALPNVLVSTANSVSPPPGKEPGISPETSPMAKDDKQKPAPNVAKDEALPDTTLNQVSVSELAGRIDTKEQAPVITHG